MLKLEYNKHLKELCASLIATAEQGQKEYALSEDAFDNFNRLSIDLGLHRNFILYVYLKKHLDGVVSYMKGHKSQRESVHGRIKDSIVYLTLLDAMIAEEERSNAFAQIDNTIGEINLGSAK